MPSSEPRLPRVLITLPFCLDAPGGMTSDCLSLAHALAAAGAEVLVLPVQTQDWDHFPRSRWSVEQLGSVPAARLRAAGVEVVGVPRHPLSFELDGLAMRRAIAPLLAARRIDGLLGWVHETRFLAALLRRHQVLNGMVAAASYAPLLHPAPGLLQPIAKLNRDAFYREPLRRAELVMARSEFTRGEVVALAGVEPERVRVVHCCVDPAFFGVEREAAPELRRLIFFGQLCAEKGVFDLVEALGSLAARGRRDWTLRIAGWGEREAVRRAVRAAGIEGQVEMAGPLDRDEVRRALAWAQLAVLPSRMESFGLAIAEAQAAGLPVIAYRAAAVPEVVADGETGWLVPPGEVGLLAAAIATAMDEPAVACRLGLAGRARTWERFRPERLAARTLAVLAEAIERRRAAAGRRSGAAGLAMEAERGG
jgi:glycosyltransferase involved in cell wall biosynthesis